ncbi:hypothetical protein THAOC_15045, partial [Thalassiosira oceanica]
GSRLLCLVGARRLFRWLAHRGLHCGLVGSRY